MDTFALALVVGGALVHASWNLLAKKASGGTPFVWLYGVVSLMAALPLGWYAWHQQAQPLTAAAWVAVTCSALLHLGYALVLQQGYRVSDFSVVYPLARGTGPCFAVLGAIVVLGEAPSALGWSGIVAIVAGIFLIADGMRLLTVRSQKTLAGVRWGSLTGVFIAAYTVVDGWAVKSLGMPPVLYYVVGLVLRTALLAPQALSNPPALRRQWQQHRPYILGVGVLAPVAYTLVLFAMTRAPLAYVAPLRELSMLLGVLFGAKVLREALTPSRVLGTVCMLLGVAALALTKQ